MCFCHDGRYGLDCQFEGNDTCDSDRVNNCHGNGKCTYNDDGLANCSCVDGYEELFECKTLLPFRNECMSMPSKCENGGICVFTGPNQYRCDCPPGKRVSVF